MGTSRKKSKKINQPRNEGLMTRDHAPVPLLGVKISGRLQGRAVELAVAQRYRNFEAAADRVHLRLPPPVRRGGLRARGAHRRPDAPRRGRRARARLRPLRQGDVQGRRRGAPGPGARKRLPAQCRQPAPRTGGGHRNPHGVPRGLQRREDQAVDPDHGGAALLPADARRRPAARNGAHHARLLARRPLRDVDRYRHRVRSRDPLGRKPLPPREVHR